MENKLTIDGLFAKAWIELDLNLIECAVATMDNIIEINPKLNRVQQELFENIHKKRLGPYRDILHMDDKELVTNERDLELVEYVKEDAFSKLQECVDYSIKKLDEVLIPAIIEKGEGEDEKENIKSKIFYFRIKADYFRYLAEFTAPEKNQTPFEESRKSYVTAIELAQKNLEATDPILLGIVLNYSLFIANFMNDEKTAVELANKTLQEYYKANEERTEVSEHDAVEETELINSIEKNVQMWSKPDDEEENESEEEK